MNELTAVILPILPSIYLPLWKQFPEDLLEYVQEDLEPLPLLSWDLFDVVKDLRFYDSDIWFQRLDDDEYLQFGFTVQRLNDLEQMNRKREENSGLNFGSVVCEAESIFVEPKTPCAEDVVCSDPDVCENQDVKDGWDLDSYKHLTAVLTIEKKRSKEEQQTERSQQQRYGCYGSSLVYEIYVFLLLRVTSYYRYSVWTQLLFIYCGRPPNFQDHKRCQLKENSETRPHLT